jgi:hypothetical protein
VFLRRDALLCEAAYLSCKNQRKSNSEGHSM